MSPARQTVVAAHEAVLENADGSAHIDLFAANGTLLLGHSHPGVVAVMAEQNQKVWITGRLDTDTRLEATRLVEQAIPSRLKVGGFYSTGMEAAEFALRAARVWTGRRDFVGFGKAMHGKSIATAFLAWDAPHGHAVPGIRRLPFPTSDQGPAVLAELEPILAQRTTAAVFLEPLQGSGGGAVVDADFCAGLTRLCEQHGTLLVVDEILTGFHRTGPLFFHDRLPLVPDVVLAGKCIGNGFPVSVVLLRRDLEITAAMLPFSTYAENALACAAVVGTLREIDKLPVARLATDIEARINAHLDHAAPANFQRSVFGALCIINCGDAALAARLADACYASGVLISQAGPMLRLLPPVTIEPEVLERALDVLDAVIAEALT